MHVQVSLEDLSILLGLYSKAELLDHIIILSLTFSRNDQHVFHSGCNTSYSYQQQTRILISLHSCQYCQPIFFLSPFHFSFLIDVLRGARRHFIVVCKDISWFQKYLDIHITICKIRQPVEIRCMMQGAQIQCSMITQRGGMRWEVGRRFKRERHMHTYG